MLLMLPTNAGIHQVTRGNPFAGAVALEIASVVVAAPSHFVTA